MGNLLCYLRKDRESPLLSEERIWNFLFIWRKDREFPLSCEFLFLTMSSAHFSYYISETDIKLLLFRQLLQTKYFTTVNQSQ